MDALKPYQIEGVDFLSARTRAFLADDTGLGKSVQALKAADQAGHERVLILCQEIGRISWAIEVPKWEGPIKRTLVMWEHAEQVIPAGPVVVVVAFGTMSRAKDRQALYKRIAQVSVFGDFNLLVVDEAHALMSQNSNRTKQVYGAFLNLSNSLISRLGVGAVWLLSATFTKKHIGDMYPHLVALFPDLLEPMFGFGPNEADFIAKFCVTHDTPYGVEVDGNNPIMVELLVDLLKPHTLRRMKRDVLDLGEVFHVVIPFEVEAITIADDVALGALLDTLGDDQDVPDVLPPAAATARKLLGIAKIPHAIKWATDWLDNHPGQKLGIFAHHRDVLESLKAGLASYAPALIYGGVTPKYKSSEVNRFQNDPACRLFLGQTIAAGTSITLTAASTVLMLEPSGVHSDDYQALSRFHRLGQLDPVTAFWAHAAGTVDDRFVRRAQRRAQDFENFIGALGTKGAI